MEYILLKYEKLKVFFLPMRTHLYNNCHGKVLIWEFKSLKKIATKLQRFLDKYFTVLYGFKK